MNPRFHTIVFLEAKIDASIDIVGKLIRQIFDNLVLFTRGFIPFKNESVLHFKCIPGN